MKTTTKLIACYVRVSTECQNEAGQKAEIEKWLTGNGVDPSTVRWFTDKKTGDNLNRPGFAKLQSDIFSGVIGSVIVYKLDRLSRSMRDGINVLCDWCDRGLRVVSVTQQIDLSGPVGRMIAAVLLGIAEMEQVTRRERQRAGIEIAKKEGKYKGRAKGTLKASPERAAELREKGLTIAEIELALKIKRNTVFRYLRTAKSI
jgi:DNA invertase Pin-like site-specific DNA recombinase